MVNKGNEFQFDDVVNIENSNSSKIDKGKEYEGGGKWGVKRAKLVEKNCVLKKGDINQNYILLIVWEVDVITLLGLRVIDEDALKSPRIEFREIWWVILNEGDT